MLNTISIIVSLFSFFSIIGVLFSGFIWLDSEKNIGWVPALFFILFFVSLFVSLVLSIIVNHNI